MEINYLKQITCTDSHGHRSILFKARNKTHREIERNLGLVFVLCKWKRRR